jgi:predicted phage tail protein
MEKELGKNISEQGRIKYLSSNCEKIEEMGYMKHFTQEQLVQMKETLSEVDIKLNDVQDELKEVKSEFKARIEPLADERKKLLQGLKNKAEYVTEPCYKFVNTDTKEVGYYNSEGDLIASRKAFQEELQGNLFHLKTGTSL